MRVLSKKFAFLFLGFLLAAVGVAAVAVLILFGFVSTPLLHAQSPAPDLQTTDGGKIAFDVASIKLNDSSDDTRMVYQLRRSGLFSAENVPARFLLRLAYGVQDVQITGGPSWINSKRYNIQAKAEGISNPDQMLPMLQTLLADRFKLVIHSETKELQVYNLVEEKRSSKLEAAKPGGCFVRVPNMPRPAPPAGQSDALACGKIYFPGPNEMLGRGVRMPSFADGLSSRVGRTVIDKTADSGTYDVDFRWTPDQNSAAVQSADSAVPPDPDDVVPSISKALREQLGLKLDSAKGPVRVLVVDSIEEPSGN